MQTNEIQHTLAALLKAEAAGSIHRGRAVNWFTHPRVAIVGSRKFKHLWSVRDYVNLLPDTSTVISGGAKGVDSVAIEAARGRKLAHEVYRADWKKYGRRAGFLRNQILVEKADRLIAFWDGKSRGTKITIDLARKAGKFISVFEYQEQVSPPRPVGTTARRLMERMARRRPRPQTRDIDELRMDAQELTQELTQAGIEGVPDAQNPGVQLLVRRQTPRQ